MSNTSNNIYNIGIQISTAGRFYSVLPLKYLKTVFFLTSFSRNKIFVYTLYNVKGALPQLNLFSTVLG